MKRLYVVPSALVLGVLVLAAGVMIARLAAVPVGVLTRDAVATADLPPYTGAIAAFNVMVWFAAASLAAFVAWIDPGERRRMALFAGLLFVLAADDSLLLHDAVGPHLGVDEMIFYVVYAASALAVSYVMHGAERTVGFAFWSGATLLAVSALVDVGFMRLYLLEDGAKLLGALVWLTVPILARSSRLDPVRREHALVDASDTEPRLSNRDGRARLENPHGLPASCPELVRNMNALRQDCICGSVAGLAAEQGAQG